MKRFACLPASTLPCLFGLCALAAAFSMAPSARAEDQDLIEYAGTCAAQMDGIAVPDFDCLSGIEIPMTGTEGGACTKPPYLPGAKCYRNSRIGDLGSSEKVGMLFLCRHKQAALPTSNKWNDIAVIQANFQTGATCFFQQLDNTNGNLSGQVERPGKGGDKWYTPTEMAKEANACVQCHDNGAFLRTPYIAQVAKDIPALTRFAERNKQADLRKRYWFPGEKFLFWKPGHNWNGSVYRVSLPTGSLCSSCHAMGTSDIGADVGTSTWLGLMSTGAVKTPYLEGASGPYHDLAFWMRPFLSEPSPTSKDASIALNDCARNNAGQDCEKILFEGQTKALTDLAEKAARMLDQAHP